MFSKLPRKCGLIIKPQIGRDVGNGFSGPAQLIAGGMHPHFDDVLLRRHFEMLFELPLKLPH